MNGFKVSVSTDKRHYGRGEPIAITTQVCRTAASPAMTSSGGGNAVLTSIQIIDDESGEVVADDSHAVLTAELLGVPWAPGQCRSTQFYWDQHRWNRDERSDQPKTFGRPARGLPVQPGRYFVRILWMTARWSDVPHPEGPFDSTVFFIEP